MASNNNSNTRVVCRFRPLLHKEKKRGEQISDVLQFDRNSNSVFFSDGTKSQGYAFDNIFIGNDNQELVFSKSGSDYVNDVLNGMNAAIITYGQTAAGKTHTMMGPSINDENLRGIIPRMVEKIFDGAYSASTDVEFTIKVSYMEIYNENIFDLLSNTGTSRPLNIRESKNGQVYVAGVSEFYVSDEEEVFQLMSQGAANRALAETAMNQESSRSHAIFQMVVRQKNLTNNSVRQGTLFLVDLAGSEKVKKTGAKGQTLNEAKNINKSLSALGNVINRLTDGSNGHIPYRDSKLTRVLQNALGGNSKTCLIICCSPMDTEIGETLSSLRFGVRAKKIQNSAKINVEMSTTELKDLLKQANREILLLKNHISKLENLEAESKDASASVTALEEASKLESEIELYKETIENLKAEKDDIVNQLMSRDEEVESLENTLNTLLSEKKLLTEEKSSLLLEKNDLKENLAELKLEKEKIDHSFQEQLKLYNELKDQPVVSNLVNKTQNSNQEGTQQQDQKRKRQVTISDSPIILSKERRSRIASRKIDVWKATTEQYEKKEEKLKHISDALKKSKGTSSAARSRENSSVVDVAKLWKEIKRLEKDNVSLVKERDDLLKKHLSETETFSKSVTSNNSIKESNNLNFKVADIDNDQIKGLESMIAKLEEEVIRKGNVIDEQQWVIKKMESSNKNISISLQKYEEDMEGLQDVALQRQELELQVSELHQSTIDQMKEFEDLKTTLLEDLQNRCDRVVELEEELDFLKDEMIRMEASQSVKGANEKIKNLENAVKESQKNLKKAQYDNTNLLSENDLLKSKVIFRDDRIENMELVKEDLEKRLEEQKGLHANDILRYEKVIEDLRWVDTELKDGSEPVLGRSRIATKVARPIRGLGRKIKRTERYGGIVSDEKKKGRNHIGSFITSSSTVGKSSEESRTEEQETGRRGSLWDRFIGRPRVDSLASTKSVKSTASQSQFYTPAGENLGKNLVPSTPPVSKRLNTPNSSGRSKNSNRKSNTPGQSNRSSYVAAKPINLTTSKIIYDNDEQY